MKVHLGLEEWRKAGYPFEASDRALMGSAVPSDAGLISSVISARRKAL